MHSHRRMTAALVAALATTAVAAPAGVAKPADLGGPAAASAGTVVDLRSPDTIDGIAPTPAPTGVDLRSPDAREGRAPGVTVVEVPQPPVLQRISDGFEWWSAVAGAGAVIALGLLAFTGRVAVIRHRGEPGAGRTTVAAGH